MKLTIPKTINIGQIKYKIKKESIEGSPLGYHEVNKNNHTIGIDSKLKGDSRDNVFIHELVHAMLWEMGHDLTEDEFFVQSLTNMIQQVNKQLYGK